MTGSPRLLRGCAALLALGGAAPARLHAQTTTTFASAAPASPATAAGQTHATESPRERGRVLQKRNPLASEYQAPGTLGRSPGAQSDGEGNDFRRYFGDSGTLLAAGDLVRTGAFATLQSLSGRAVPGGTFEVRQARAGGARPWAWSLRGNVTSADRLIEHYEAAWAPVTELGNNGRYAKTGAPVLNRDGREVFFLERPRVSQDTLATRTRTLDAQVETRFNGEHLLFVQVFWSDYADDFYRHRIELNTGAGLPQSDGDVVDSASSTVMAGDYRDASARRYFAHTITTRDILRFHVGGRSPFAGGRIDYGLYHARWRNDSPSDAWNFTEKGLDLHYDISEPAFPLLAVINDRDLAELERSTFNDLRASHTLTRDLDWAARLDYERKGRWRDIGWWLTMGTLHREKERTNDSVRDVYLRTSAPLTLASVARDGATGLVVRDHYELPAGLDAGAGRRRVGAADPAFGYNESRSLLESFQERYTSRERVGGAFAMAQAKRGSWELELGIRGEGTRTDTLGTVIAPVGGGFFGPELARVIEGGTTYSIQQAPGENRYTTWLPSLGITRKLGPRFAIRAAYFEQLMRPQYFDIVAYRRLNPPTRTLTEGNPALRPTSIRTAVAALDAHVPPLGEWSFELYATEVEDFFYNAQDYETVDGEIYTAGRVANGSTADLHGLQVQWSRAWTLLAPLRIESSAAYAYSDSEARLPTRLEDRIPLPERSRHLLRGELAWSIGRWRGSWEVTTQSAALDEVGPAANRDVYRARVLALDASIAWRPVDGWNASLTAQNLTDAPERAHEGDPLRVTRNQYSGTLWRLGVEHTW
ncbi:MAG TPA: TonB-dependent receptor [Opitutaceae bacterium]